MRSFNSKLVSVGLQFQFFNIKKAPRAIPDAFIIDSTIPKRLRGNPMLQLWEYVMSQN
jgi:hypothetical protein